MILPSLVLLAKNVLGNREQVRILRRWAITRGRTVLARRRIVRGTRIEWPQLGRAWTVPYELVAPGPSEVLIRTVKSCVSPGTERAMFMRRPNTAAPFPYYPGYSLAGEIVRVGQRVTDLHPGDVVATSAPHASVAVVDQHRAYRVPPPVSLEEASFLHMATIALYGLLQGRMQSGERVVVLGRGLIGQLLIQLASIHGAGFLASVARTAARSTPVLRQHAQELITLEQAGPSALGSLEADVAYEATGDPEAIHDAIRATRRGGRVVLVGSPRGVTSQVDLSRLAERGTTLIGAHISGLRNGSQKTGQDGTAQHAASLLQLMAQHRLDVRSLISERVNPLESGQFYRRLCHRGNHLITALFSWDMLEADDRVRNVSFARLPEIWPAQHVAMSRSPLPYRLDSPTLTGGGMDLSGAQAPPSSMITRKDGYDQRSS